MNCTDQKTCIIYCRVSSKEQIEGTSLETQAFLCREHAEKHGWHVLAVFIEMGESAKTADRTEFNKAITFCTKKKNRIDFFLVYRFDRFARNTGDHLALKTLLQKSGTRIVSVTEPTTEDPTGKFLETVMAARAEWDNGLRSVASKTGMEKRVQEGYWVWASPLGYYKPVRGKKTNIVPDPEAAPIVRAGFEEYAKGGRTYKALAAYWTGRGLRTRRGKPIKLQEVQKMLRNPVYCGIIRSKFGEWPGGFEPIVSRQVFLACQGKPGRASAWAKPRSTDNAMFPLRKLIICAECGSPFTGSVSRSGERRYPYYHHFTKGCSKKGSHAKDDFELAFMKHLSGIALDQQREQLFRAVIGDILKTKHKNFDVQATAARSKMEKLQMERQRVYDLHRDGTYSTRDFVEQRAIINARIEEQETLLEDGRGDGVNLGEALGYCLEFASKPAKTWLELEENYPARIRLQGLIFRNRLPFDGRRFGTAELSPIFQLKETLLAEESLLVAPRGIEPLFAP